MEPKCSSHFRHHGDRLWDALSAISYVPYEQNGNVRAGGKLPFLADFVEKVFLGWRPKFFRTADAFRTRGYEGPHHFVQKRSWSFVSALRSIALVVSAKNQRLRDFRRRSIFDFCNNIGT
jgi:hypothetical protein